MLIARGRGWESAYRDRWRHDKVVRSTHGVNCTGSCSWNVYVKDGLITWESQAVDYPRTDPDRPNHEPRGCPRGRVVLVVHVLAGPPEVSVRARQPARALARRDARRRRTRSRRSPRSRRTARYRGERGRGGFVRCDWEEASELIAAATVHAIREHGPDRVGGFTPIPAMSPVSFAAGTRFLSLIGGHTTTFYDWYADLPPASPQVFGDQTDVPGVGGLVGRELLDRVGHEPADHAHAGRALHDRGALSRPEGRGRLAGLLRSREVRRRLAAGPAGHRRGAGDGDGSRDAQGVLGRSAGARASRTTASASPTCRCSSRSSERDGVHVPGRFLMAADIGERRRARGLEAGACSTPSPASRRCRTGRSASATASRARAAGTSGSARSIPCCRCMAATSRRSRSRCRASTSATGPGGARDAPRRAGDPGRRPARDDGAGSDARDLRRRARRAAGRVAGGLRRRDAAVHAGVAGGDHLASTAGWRSRSRASSRATRRSAAGAR